MINAKIIEVEAQKQNEELGKASKRKDIEKREEDEEKTWKATKI